MTTTDAIKILNRITGDDLKLREAIEEQKLNVRVAEIILEAREAAGLTQAEVAERVGTTQSAISRLEDADYDGHSLACDAVRRLKSATERMRRDLPMHAALLLEDRIDKHQRACAKRDWSGPSRSRSLTRR